MTDEQAAAGDGRMLLWQSLPHPDKPVFPHLLSWDCIITAEFFPLKKKAHHPKVMSPTYFHLYYSEHSLCDLVFLFGCFPGDLLLFFSGRLDFFHPCHFRCCVLKSQMRIDVERHPNVRMVSSADSVGAKRVPPARSTPSGTATSSGSSRLWPGCCSRCGGIHGE